MTALEKGLIERSLNQVQGTRNYLHYILFGYDISEKERLENLIVRLTIAKKKQNSDKDAIDRELELLFKEYKQFEE